MEVLLAKVTQQAMNYAIRTGITITSGYAIQQCGRLLKTVDGKEKEELASLQLRLDSKIKIISPAIDMIELIAARGNTSLESAVMLTKSLRYEIQELGLRCNKAEGQNRLARRGSSKGRSRAENDFEVKQIIVDMKKLLERIEDAVPLINLAITTSGVSLSSSLPSTVSPSRLLQASTFLTAGDTEYCRTMPQSQQIGPVFTLSMYMLFSGHAYRPHDEEGIRETTWKEVIHKARVKLLRVPLDKVHDYPTSVGSSTEGSGLADGHQGASVPSIPSEGKMHEFAYQLLVIEDLDDDRVHTFEEGEARPGPYEGVPLAGIRELIPIHQISKIFYADTGKILNIGADGETNNPILLLKRDTNAVPPRRMMEHQNPEYDYESDESGSEHVSKGEQPRTEAVPEDEHHEIDEEQAELEAQLFHEVSINDTGDIGEEPIRGEPIQQPWRLPPNLDLEWIAFEVYVEEPVSEDEYDEDTELGVSESTPATSSANSPIPVSSSIINGMADLTLDPSSRSTSTSRQPPTSQIVPSPQSSSYPISTHMPPRSMALPIIKTSLSLLEMLIRLTALQQFKQDSHLAIPDEFLTFFLSESATVGAGGDSELRRRARREARLRVGFDPYDESPIKRRGEEYLEHEFHPYDAPEGARSERHRSATPSYDYNGYPHGPTRSPHSRGTTPLRSSPAPYPSSLLHINYSNPSSPTTTSTGLGISPDYPLPSRETQNHSQSRLHPPSNLASPSPLLRRATTQPQFKVKKQPAFGDPLTAPHTSSSPKSNPVKAGGMEKGSQAPATPPSSRGKGL
ncbi:Ran-binding-domain-containing protein [Delitschia confertaspora ATCC 74209]|uniref:Ran-binding-domain-containing protein n=1 Tax=Delitschia confertaspora ATCC 74209 TaxID=1513339 RepID=A0A9P4JJT1_9PLEO|nr:Ran-binding-domain-containing protein [Delitschia confertaspora ATCC 74209]